MTAVPLPQPMHRIQADGSDDRADTVVVKGNLYKEEIKLGKYFPVQEEVYPCTVCAIEHCNI